ncbi:MAG: hypothetical protein ABIP06_03495 [Pyrinomonadaceae bacterium]
MGKNQFQNLHKPLLIAGFILFSVFTFRAQSELNDLPTKNSWRNFKLDFTTADTIVKELGKPKKDQIETLKSSLSKDLTDSSKAVKTRLISYKKIGNYDSVEFTFTDDILVGMNFLIRQNRMKGLANRKSDLFQAKNLSENFETDFIIFNGLPKNAKITDFEGQKETTVPKVYKQNYLLLGINNDSVIFVSVDNTNFKSSIKEIFDKPTVELFPGFTQRIQIYSRAIVK